MAYVITFWSFSEEALWDDVQESVNWPGPNCSSLAHAQEGRVCSMLGPWLLPGNRALEMFWLIKSVLRALGFQSHSTSSSRYFVQTISFLGSGTLVSAVSPTGTICLCDWCWTPQLSQASLTDITCVEELWVPGDSAGRYSGKWASGSSEFHPLLNLLCIFSP